MAVQAGPRSFEFRLRVALTVMLVPTAISSLIVIVGLLHVAGAQRTVADELARELSAISDVKRDLGSAARIVAGVATPASREDFLETVTAIDRHLAGLRVLDEPVEVEVAERAAQEWRRGRDAAVRALAAGPSAGSIERGRAVRHFDAAGAELASLGELSRDELEAEAEASSSVGRRIAVGALVVGAFATALNLRLIRRLLEDTTGPLRQLTEGVEGFSVDDLEHRVTVEGDREFRAVGDAFNSMAGRLQNALESLEHQAYHDPLTGLGNRASLIRRLQAEREQRAVLLLDLDDFKAINDGLGHAAGDDALIQIARRLQRSIRPDDLVARLGGDEFAVVLESAGSLEEVEAVAGRIVGAIAEPIEVAGRPLVLHASGGIALVDAAQDAAETVRRADIALYVAKETSKGCARLFEPEMLRDVERRLELETALRDAVGRDEIEVHYQPIVNTQTGRVTSMEALLRWHHPSHGHVSPAVFIPIAEASGQILSLGRFVLTTACRQVREWQQLEGHERLSVNVNVSAVQLYDGAIVEDVAMALRACDLAPERLILEVTETVMARPEAVARLHELKALGVRIALDDFGTGYSALSYLQRLPIDVLKVDKSFIDDIATTADRAVLATAIVRLGHSLGLETVAEGVERADQLDVLGRVGCDVVQGYLIARPQPAAKAGATLLSAGAERAAPARGDTTAAVHVKVGPLPATPAREWLQHAHWAIDELEAGRFGEHRPPPSVIAIMRDFVGRWTEAAMSGDTFHWEAAEDADVLATLMRHWRIASAALVKASEEGADVISPAAAAFSSALANALLTALATQTAHDVEAAALARQWQGGHTPTPPTAGAATGATAPFAGRAERSQR